MMKIRRITSHPKITPARLAQMRTLRAKIDREEKREILAKGRGAFARYEKIRQTISGLNALRERRHLTLEQLAERTGIGKANLSRLFNQKHPNPTIDTLLRISEAVDYELLRHN
ncbi:MAG TPA: helix-turn-helix transcriptional regulator [Tepidisphaeraceae bacterium]|nr:helix-turn-helix transcriptional regulator [Tepidisphaeraceae bacterium]